MRLTSVLCEYTRAAALAACTLASGCSALLPKPAPPPSFYVLEAVPSIPAPASTPAPTGPSLVVQAPLAAAGFDSARIVYIRKAHQVEHFAHSEWIGTPVRMLAPLIVAAAGSSSAFRVVAMAPSAAAADLRLETELLRLQHEFGSSPSRVRMTLRAVLTDSSTRRVLARQDFEALADAPSEDAYGGVLAANQASGMLLRALAEFCAEAARRWQPGEARPVRGAFGR